MRTKHNSRLKILTSRIKNLGGGSHMAFVAQKKIPRQNISKSESSVENNNKQTFQSAEESDLCTFRGSGLVPQINSMYSLMPHPAGMKQFMLLILNVKINCFMRVQKHINGEFLISCLMKSQILFPILFIYLASFSKYFSCQQIVLILLT